MSMELNKESVEQAGGDERAKFEERMMENGRDISTADGEYLDPLVERDWKARAALAQPSPAQAEAERPEVVARVVHSNPVVLGQCGPLNANDELMTVAQHAASVARWAEMFNRVEQQRDAALVEVERLRESKGDPVGSFEKCMKVMYERDEHAKRLEVAQARVAELEAKLAEMEKQVAVAWGAFHFGGERDGKLYTHCETEAQIDAYILDMHRSSDSLTLRKSPPLRRPCSPGSAQRAGGYHA
ncbi:hypothetical protein [Pseudomonas aeruginosa]|uniref:hypothetical protein n=1 Tax=Pseudomonas aeruginosa TaxID=287 RepID=UPI002F3F00E1